MGRDREVAAAGVLDPGTGDEPGAREGEPLVTRVLRRDADHVGVRLVGAIAAAHPDAEVSWLDGVSVDYPDWHFNVRPSNTEPLLRLNLESLVSREDMEAKRDEMLAFIRS